METSAFREKSISELVDQNYVHGYVLYYLGVRFYECSGHTLEQVCRERNLRLEQVIRELESPSLLQDAKLPLLDYPIDLIIEYLKHAHFIFIKHKLPYIGRLVESFRANHPDYIHLEKDLKLVFPLFVEDFIEHIYEEEDTLFCYIRLLERALKGKANLSRLYYQLEKNSIHKLSVEHEAHDDEMEGIRRITNNYTLDPTAPLHIRVIFQELQEFEKSLITHARIENEILFPKAMALENKVKQIFFEKTRFN